MYKYYKFLLDNILKIPKFSIIIKTFLIINFSYFNFITINYLQYIISIF